jgi:anti-sigma factor RsiW
MANCDQWRELISAYADGEGTPEEQREARVHLHGCAECRRWLKDLKQDQRLFVRAWEERQQSDPLAVASLILGITAITVLALAIIDGPLAIIFGIVSLRRRRSGRGVAVAGLVIGAIGLLLQVALVGAWWWTWAPGPRG